MALFIRWDQPLIPEDQVLQLRPTELDDFYFSASEPDKSNLFFILLNSLHYYEGKGDCVRAAYLSFLTANYLFVALTPPGSYDLALHYMKKALVLEPKEEYRQWLALMEQGN